MPYFLQLFCGYPSMQNDIADIEKVRNQYESSIMATDGVESVSIGVGKNGKPCLNIGISKSEHEVRSKLPQAIYSAPIEFIFVGNITAE